MAFPTRDLNVHTLVSVESWNYSSMHTEGNYIFNKTLRQEVSDRMASGRQAVRQGSCNCYLEFTANLSGDRRLRTGQPVLLLGHPQGHLIPNGVL